MLNNDAKTALESFNIVKDGITTEDLEFLTVLKENPQGAGLHSLCAYMNTQSDTVIHDIEPYLMKNRYMMKTPRGRKITEKGEKLLQTVGM